MADTTPSRILSSATQDETKDAVRLHHAKEIEILRACDEADAQALIQLATSSGGLISDKARRDAWPILLGCDVANDLNSTPWQDLQPHKDEHQVSLDVDRAFVYYPKDLSEKASELYKSQLSNVILAVLRRHPFLNYFQGYHDIAQVFLLVLGAAAAVPALERLSLLRIRDFMLPTMTASIAQLSLLPALLAAADPELHMHLVQTAPFYFALPATLTLYAHDIQEYGDIARLFDYLIAHGAVISIYLFAIVICSRKGKLLELGADEHDMLHATLSKLPKPLDVDALIKQTDSLFQRHPPERLRGYAWYNTSRNSVLKTTRYSKQVLTQSLEEGSSYFQRYAREIQHKDARQIRLNQLSRLGSKYRLPALFVGSSVLIAIVSIYLVRQPSFANPQRLLGVFGPWRDFR